MAKSNIIRVGDVEILALSDGMLEFDLCNFFPTIPDEQWQPHAAKLTGEYVLDHHTASQCDPLYAIREFDWNTEWAQPRLVWPSDVVGTVHRDAAAATDPASERARLLALRADLAQHAADLGIVAGTVDAYSEAFSVGVRHPGDLMLMYGSTMFLVQIIDAYYSDPALWTTAGVERGTLALAAGTSTAGSLLTWLQTVTGGAPSIR